MRKRISLVFVILFAVLVFSACSSPMSADRRDAGLSAEATGTIRNVLTGRFAPVRTTVRYGTGGNVRNVFLTGAAYKQTGSGKQEDAPAAHVESVSISETDITVYLGKKKTLIVTVLPEDAADPSVSWASSDESVLTIDEDGTVRPVGPGKAVVTCTAKDGSDAFASCSVEVVVGTTELKLSKEKAKLLLGAGQELARVELTCEVLPENTSFPGVVWSSSDTSIATVDETGVVTGIKAGKATITAVTTDPKNSGSVKAECAVSVGNAVKEIKITGKSRIVKGKDAQLTAKITPEKVLSSKVKWKSSNKSVATVDKNGKVHAVGTGTATITVTAQDGSGVTAEKKITVYKPVTKLTPNKKSATIFAGQTVKLKAKASPSDASNKKVTWKSSKSSVASVDENGVVTGKKKGTATITATAKDGSGVKCTFSIRVESANPVTISSAGFGIYNADLFVLNVKNNTTKKTVVNFDFDLVLYSYSGNILIPSGSYNLGKNVKIAPGGKLKIERNLSGISSTYMLEITITGVKFSDGKTYEIPASKQKTYYFSR